MFGLAAYLPVRSIWGAMKTIITTTTKTALLCGLIFLCCVAARAQEAKINLDSLAKLEDQAAQTVEVNLDSELLKTAIKVLGKGATEEKIKELVRDLQGIYVRNFQFDRAGEYQDADIHAIRDQIRTPGWARIVGVRSRKGGENIEVYAKTEGQRLSGVVILAFEPRELTVVNIVGPLDLEKLAELASLLRIPGFDIEKTSKPKQE